MRRLHRSFSLACALAALGAVLVGAGCGARRGGPARAADAAWRGCRGHREGVARVVYRCASAVVLVSDHGGASPRLALAAHLAVMRAQLGPALEIARGERELGGRRWPSAEVRAELTQPRRVTIAESLLAIPHGSGSRLLSCASPDVAPLRARCYGLVGDVARAGLPAGVPIE